MPSQSLAAAWILDKAKMTITGEKKGTDIDTEAI